MPEPSDTALLITSDSGRLLAIWAVGLFGIAAGLFARGWLSRGVGDGLFVAGLSGLLVVNYTWGGDPRDADWLFRVGASLTALSLLWLVIALWVERPAPNTSNSPSHAADRPLRRTLAWHACVIAALLVLGLSLADTQPPGTTGPTLPVSMLLLLLVICAAAWFKTRSSLAAYAAAAVLLRALTLLLPTTTGAAQQIELSLGLLGMALVALLIVLATIVADRRRRTEAWRTNPARLVEPAPAHPYAYAIALVVAIMVGLGAIVTADVSSTPVALGLAALTVLGIGHRWCSNALGEAGLALAGGAVVTVGTAWVGGGQAGAILGWGLAGAWLLWLGRFWEQQLDDGRPWTTAGRLIPAARRLGLVAAAGTFAWAAAWAAECWTAEPSAGWWSLFPALTSLLLGMLHLGDARQRQESHAAVAGGLALLSAAAVAGLLVSAQGAAVVAALPLGAAALLMALRLGPARSGPTIEPIFNAYLGGMLPLTVVFGLAAGGVNAETQGAALLAAGCVVAAVAVRWGSRRPGTHDAG